MFSGEHQISVDIHNRVIVPTTFRDELGANVVLWRGLDGQIMIHPHEVWQQAVNKLAQQPMQQEFREARWVLQSGTQMEMDRQGRLVVPPLLRRYADLGSDPVVVGMNDHLELWSLERWEEKTRSIWSHAGPITNQLGAVGINV